MAADELHEVTFVWPHPEPQTVIVTGTFDEWARSVPLSRTATGFSTTIKVPWGQKVKYKFIVDGQWANRDDQPMETDPGGFVNNVYVSPPKVASSVDQPSIIGVAQRVEVNGSAASVNGNIPEVVAELSKPENGSASTSNGLDDDPSSETSQEPAKPAESSESNSNFKDSDGGKSDSLSVGKATTDAVVSPLADPKVPYTTQQPAGGYPQLLSDLANTIVARDGTTSALGYVASGIGAAMHSVVGVDPINIPKIAIPTPKPGEEFTIPGSAESIPNTADLSPESVASPTSPEDLAEPGISPVAPRVPIMIVPVNAAENNTTPPASLPEPEFTIPRSVTETAKNQDEAEKIEAPTKVAVSEAGARKEEVTQPSEEEEEKAVGAPVQTQEAEEASAPVAVAVVADAIKGDGTTEVPTVDTEASAPVEELIAAPVLEEEKAAPADQDVKADDSVVASVGEHQPAITAAIAEPATPKVKDEEVKAGEHTTPSTEASVEVKTETVAEDSQIALAAPEQAGPPTKEAKVEESASPETKVEAPASVESAEVKTEEQITEALIISDPEMKTQEPTHSAIETETKAEGTTAPEAPAIVEPEVNVGESAVSKPEAQVEVPAAEAPTVVVESEVKVEDAVADIPAVVEESVIEEVKPGEPAAAPEVVAESAPQGSALPEAPIITELEAGVIESIPLDKADEPADKTKEPEAKSEQPIAPIESEIKVEEAKYVPTISEAPSVVEEPVADAKTEEPVANEPTPPVEEVEMEVAEPEVIAIPTTGEIEIPVPQVVAPAIGQIEEEKAQEPATEIKTEDVSAPTVVEAVPTADESVAQAEKKVEKLLVQEHEVPAEESTTSEPVAPAETAVVQALEAKVAEVPVVDVPASVSTPVLSAEPATADIEAEGPAVEATVEAETTAHPILSTEEKSAESSSTSENAPITEKVAVPRSEETTALKGEGKHENIAANDSTAKKFPKKESPEGTPSSSVYNSTRKKKPSFFGKLRNIFHSDKDKEKK